VPSGQPCRLRGAQPPTSREPAAGPSAMVVGWTEGARRSCGVCRCHPTRVGEELCLLPPRRRRGPSVQELPSSGYRVDRPGRSPRSFDDPPMPRATPPKLAIVQASQTRRSFSVMRRFYTARLPGRPRPWPERERRSRSQCPGGSDSKACVLGLEAPHLGFGIVPFEEPEEVMQRLGACLSLLLRHAENRVPVPQNGPPDRFGHRAVIANRELSCCGSCLFVEDQSRASRHTVCVSRQGTEIQAMTIRRMHTRAGGLRRPA
jgi:hypothetical protein